jgi:hypothetical protein
LELNPGVAMHWNKNRIVNPESKKEIIQTDLCPGCGREVKFFYGEHGQVCHRCKKEIIEERKEYEWDRIEEAKCSH